jgi:anti-sigma B factor antagonist
MKFTKEKQDDVVVITLKGSLEGGTDTYEIQDEVKNELEAGSRKFLIDMGKASFVNSTGIGVLVASLTSVNDAGGKLKICQVNDKARRAFVVTGVWSLFDVHDSAGDAIAAF